MNKGSYPRQTDSGIADGTYSSYFPSPLLPIPLPRAASCLLAPAYSAVEALSSFFDPWFVRAYD